MESGGGMEAIQKSPAPAPAPAPVEEEAIKRNTDCVYFLASPLTCKKGSECEYRHSEGARMNPRDCWYWLNGNCLNLKCCFRHPPLEGFPGTPSGPAPPPPQTIASTQFPLANVPSSSSSKQGVPCYYFQKGLCLKGDRCSFMHGPQPSGTPASQPVAKSSASFTEHVGKVSAPLTASSQTFRNDSWVLKECNQQNFPKLSAEKPIEIPWNYAKPITKAEIAPVKNGPSYKKSSSPHPLDADLPRIQPPYFSVTGGGAPSRGHNRQVQLADERLQNGRDTDEFLAESSPGFDVLVDDEIEDTDYFQHEDDFGRVPGQVGRDLDPVNESDYRHSDYEQRHKMERDQYNGIGEFDQYGPADDRLRWEQRRSPSRRIMERPSMLERRISHREEPLDKIDGSDLRHRLKQRRLNGSRSAVSPEHRREPHRRDNRHADERYRGRDAPRDLPLRSPISTRLRGRITLPRRSSPDNSAHFRSDDVRDGGRRRGRLTPPRTINQGRHNDRLKRRADEGFSADTRISASEANRSDGVNALDFAGPKSLAELKGTKVTETSRDQQPKTMNTTAQQELKSMKLAREKIQQESEESLAFDGPKPLSTILKRKREMTLGNSTISSSEMEENQREGVDTNGTSVSAAVSVIQTIQPSGIPKESNHLISNLEEEEEEEEEGLNPAEDVDPQYHAKGDNGELDDGVDGMEVEAMEDQELENDDQQEVEYDYEETKGEGHRTGDTDDEDELDDEDDFAKKVGFILS